MSITRFKEAQERFGEYETALEEIRQGRKRSHWIWYIFPQPKGLGRSYNSEYYGIASLEEAKEYLGDAVLRGRLLEISKALIEHKEEDIHSIMGGIDAQKLRSSMTPPLAMTMDARSLERFLTPSLTAKGTGAPSGCSRCKKNKERKPTFGFP